MLFTPDPYLTGAVAAHDIVTVSVYRISRAGDPQEELASTISNFRKLSLDL